MKGKIFLTALASMFLASCTNNELVLDETKKGQEIRFAVASGTEQSRVEHDSDGAYTGNLKIWAWIEGTDDCIIEGDVYNPNTLSFQSQKIYYYPTSGVNVDFLVIPKEVVDKGYFTTPTRNADGTTDYQFSVGHTSHTASEHDVDLMTSEIITQNSNVVTVVLRHLTSKLNVRILQVERESDVAIFSVTLNDVKFKNIKNHGHVDLDEEWDAINGGVDHFWNNIDQTKVCNWDIVTTDFLLAGPDISQNKIDFETSKSHYVVPQELVDNGQQLYIKYTIETTFKNGQATTDEVVEETIDLKEIVSVPYWAMNKNITYIIHIDPVETHEAIAFDVEVEAWGNLNSNSTSIIPTEP